MKITSKRTKTGATVSIRATSKRDREVLTKAVMSGALMASLNGTLAQNSDLQLTEMSIENPVNMESR